VLLLRFWLPKDEDEFPVLHTPLTGLCGLWLFVPNRPRRGSLLETGPAPVHW